MLLTLWEGNLPVASGFLSQMVSNAEHISIILCQIICSYHGNIGQLELGTYEEFLV